MKYRAISTGRDVFYHDGAYRTLYRIEQKRWIGWADTDGLVWAKTPEEALTKGVAEKEMINSNG